MKSGLLLLTFVAWIGGINDIATVNRLKKQAKTALEQQNYAQAANYYAQLVDSLRVDDENVRLNLAHALLLSGDTAQSQLRYSQLTSSQSSAIKSVAYQQLGVLTSEQKKYPEALATFKESLKANPTNEESRYNYELVKKLLEQQQQQDQEDQQQDDQQKESKEDQEKQKQEGEQQKEEGEQGEDQEGEPQDQQSGEEEPQDAKEQEAQEGEQSEGEKDEEQSSSPVSDKLKEMNISEEKAQMILEAMRNNEMQYIQQNRRKPQKPRDRTKPDW